MPVSVVAPARTVTRRAVWTSRCGWAVALLSLSLPPALPLQAAPVRPGSETPQPEAAGGGVLDRALGTEGPAGRNEAEVLQEIRRNGAVAPDRSMPPSPGLRQPLPPPPAAQRIDGPMPPVPPSPPPRAAVPDLGALPLGGLVRNDLPLRGPAQTSAPPAPQARLGGGSPSLQAPLEPAAAPTGMHAAEPTALQQTAVGVFKLLRDYRWWLLGVMALLVLLVLGLKRASRRI